MKAIMKQELKNYWKSPFLWAGLILIFLGLYQILGPYLKIHYFASEKELQERKTFDITQIGDADIMDGYIPSSQAGADWFMVEKGELEEVNSYIENCLEEHDFTYYFGWAFTDFCSLYMGFFSTVLLAFLFIRDTKKDIYELLHTKPIRALEYVLGKVFGGFGAMALVWGILTLIFGGLCMFYGVKNALPVNFFEFLGIAAAFILPNMLMICCVYTIVALLFKNPLPAVPFLFLYIIYSNLPSRGAAFNYAGRPLAIMFRIPGRFFTPQLPEYAIMNQIFLVAASMVLMIAATAIWKRRRTY